MDQRTHAWIAIRAVGLLEDEGKTGTLVELLKPNLQAAAIGAWIPDLQDAKLGSSKTQNHVFKMAPYKGGQAARFTTPKSKMIKQLGGRMTADFLAKDKTLGDGWWSKPYKADPQPGQHLANRAMAVGTSLIDLLIFGDRNLAIHVPGEVSFVRYMSDDERTPEAQAVLFFFMLSHFVADSCMPCHCDERYLSSYSGGLHKELEKSWSEMVGENFDDKALLASGKGAESSDQILEQAKAVDGKFNLKSPGLVPEMKDTDIWLEVINICRGSFAIANIIAPPDKYKYNPKVEQKVKFDDFFGGDDGKKLLAEISSVALQDAVANVAMVWKHIWGKFKNK